MKKGIDTHFLAARQVILWAEPQGELEGAATRSLPLPRYVVRKAANVDKVMEALARSKIEVLLVELTGSQQLAELARVRAADRDLELILIADRARLEELATGAAVEELNLLSSPFVPIELVHRVEQARERRYLRRSEQRRKGVEARMSAIMKAVPTGIMSLDEDGHVHDWNPAAARLFGWSDVEALGRDFWGLVGVAADVFKADDGALALGKKLELTARHRSGRNFPIEMSLVAFPLSERTMMCAIVEDRTEAKRLELDLRQAQKLEAVGQLAAGLAHEINTPCQYIGNCAAALQGAFSDVGTLLAIHARLREAAASADVTPALLEQLAEELAGADMDYWMQQGPKSLDSILEGVRRIAGIVGAMKSFAQIDWTDQGALDVNRSVQDVLTVSEHQLRTVADVEVDLPPMAPITGHGGEINQALYNIVRNAIEAVERRVAAEGGRGRIAIRTRAEPEAVHVSVEDSGCGIPPEIRGRIFEQFFTTKEVGRGTGLGLAVAWAVIVEKHRGQISFESSEAGTVFHVRLPWLSRPQAG